MKIKDSKRRKDLMNSGFTLLRAIFKSDRARWYVAKATWAGGWAQFDGVN